MLYNVLVAQYTEICDIEAESEEEAKDIATNGYIWNDHENYHVHLEVTEQWEDD
tara:strand:- start:348 stop:509 length:162 start_codon:yes stop_codon:yes gene_type:complete